MVISRLRVQMLAVLLVACVFILGSQALIRHFLILPELEHLALQADRQDVLRVSGALKRSQKRLEDLLYDNAIWDQMYEAAQAKNVQWFVENYMLKESFEQLQINGWYFYDADLNLISGLSADADFTPFSNPLLENPSAQVISELLVSRSEVLANQLRSLGKNGFVLINNRPALVVSLSIAPSTEHGESAGTALAWHYVDQDVVNDLASTVQLDLKFHAQGELASIPHLMKMDLLQTIRLNENVPPFGGRYYLGYTDIGDKLLFGVSFAQRKRSFDSSLFDTSLVTGLLSSLATLLLFYIYLRQKLLLPIQKMSSILIKVGKTGDYSMRSFHPGNNELSQLSENIDRLFDLVASQQSELLSHNSRLQSMSHTDALTGVANRRYLDQHLEQLALNKQTETNPLSLLVIDVDHFKTFNDTYGHSQGDHVLVTVASELQKNTHKSTDLVSRFGGEEFVVVLENTEKDDAVKVAKTLCHAISTLGIIHAGSETSEVLTVSIGVAVKTASQTLMPNQLFEQADQALYKAKTRGRNRVELFTENDSANHRVGLEL